MKNNKYYKIVVKIWEMTMITMFIISMTIIGYGVGQTMETTHYVNFIISDYGLNMSINSMYKETALTFTNDYYVQYIKGITNMCTGMMLYLLSTIMSCIKIRKPL